MLGMGDERKFSIYKLINNHIVELILVNNFYQIIVKIDKN